MAPTAPGLLPDVQPSTQGAPSVDIGVPVDAFGGAVGHALAGLGQDITKDSDDVWHEAMAVQNQVNETTAKDADAQYMIKSGIMHADFLNKEGNNAGPEALQKHIQDLQDLRTSLRKDLNPAAAQMYDASSLSFMGRNIFNAASHSGQQIKVAGNNASTSRIQLAKTAMGDNPEDAVTSSRMQTMIEAEVDAQGRTNGWSDDQIKATKQQQVSEGVGHQIAGLAKTNAMGAQRMLDAATKSGQLTPEIAERVQATVQTQFRDQGSRIIADKVLADRRAGADGEDEKTEDDYIKAGLDEAAKMKSSDPLFSDFVRDRIITQYKKQQMVETDTANQNLTTVGKAMMKANAEGIAPSSIEELKAVDPDVAGAWDALSGKPKQQQAILNQLQRNAQGANRTPITPENLQAFHTAKGQAMAGTDDERAAFMAHDWASEPKMAVSQKNSLMNMQDSMRKQSSSDPRVARALNILKPAMEGAGITPSGGQANKDSYYQYTGALSDALEQYQTDHPGKTPTFDEVKTLGAQLMQEHTTGRRGWLMFTNESAPFYQMPIPGDERDRIANDPAWKKNGVTPTDSMIQRVYHAEKFRQFYGGTKPTAAPGSFPPNAPARAPGE